MLIDNPYHPAGRRYGVDHGPRPTGIELDESMARCTECWRDAPCAVAGVPFCSSCAAVMAVCPSCGWYGDSETVRVEANNQCCPDCGVALVRRTSC